MARSSGIPRRSALSGITTIIGARTSATTISRPTETTGSMGETDTTTNDHTEDLWLYDPEQMVGETPGGERVEGDLGALGLDGVDVQKNDRITHGGVEYEVDTVVGVPEDADADGTTHGEVNYFRISLTRRNL